MEDSLIIGTTAVDTVRIYAASTTGLVEEARRIHQTWATASAALGRVLTGTIILGVMADNLRRLTVEVCGDGPLGKLMAVSNQRGTVKGYLDNPQVDLDLNSMGKFDVGKAVGKGELVVTKELGIGEPYQGIVPLQTGEIAED
ncbi:MAG TPA: Hsp33 family molecular chaperone HslO, partial [Bacillota bacterium]